MNFKRRSKQWTKKRKAKEVLVSYSKTTHKNRVSEEQQRSHIEEYITL